MSAFSDALKKVNKDYKDCLVDLSGSEEYVGPIDPQYVFSTGSPLIDEITCIGGLAGGRISEIFGPEASGKSTFLLSACAVLLKKNPNARVIYSDFEHAMSIDYAKKLGVPVEDRERFIFMQPTTLEDGINAGIALVETGEISLWIVDSLAAALPKQELEGAIGDVTVGLKARVMAASLRKITGLVSQFNTHFAVVNHVIAKIGGMGFGNPEDTPGGKALKFYASQRFKLTPAGFIRGKVRNEITGQQEDVKIGINVKVEIVKNKLGVPFRTAQVLIRFGEGFDNCLSAIQIGVAKGAIEKVNASTYRFEGTAYRGLENFRNEVAADRDLYDRIINAINTANSGSAGSTAEVESEEFDENIIDIE